MKTSHLSKLTETLYRASCSVEVKAEDWVLRPGTISPDKWNPASRICSDTGTDYFKAKYILEYIEAVPGVLVWCCMMLATVVRVPGACS